MPEVIFVGPAGRIEGRYHPARQKNAPLAIVLHPHPQFGGTMNHQIVYQVYYAFVHRNFAVLRFNFRGVGRSQGAFDHGQGELSDAASALDWAQSINPEARSCWIAGFSFGAWIGMQLLMRRPEIEGFISIAPPANLYDFSFLAPCPSSGLIVHGDKDAVVPLLPRPPRSWIVAGGGARNPTMMRMLAERLAPASVEAAQTLGWSSDAIEAQAFAFLAVRSLNGLPITFPGTTGAPRPMTGGVLARP